MSKSNIVPISSDSEESPNRLSFTLEEMLEEFDNGGIPRSKYWRELITALYDTANHVVTGVTSVAEVKPDNVGNIPLLPKDIDAPAMVRMDGADSNNQQTNQDVFGRSLFYGDACKVVHQYGAYYEVLAGTAYVAGIKFLYPGMRDHLIEEDDLPTSVWIDVSWPSDPMSEREPKIKIVISNENQKDYIEKEVSHYLVLLATIDEGSWVKDFRNLSLYSFNGVTHKTISDAISDNNLSRNHLKIGADRALAEYEKIISGSDPLGFSDSNGNSWKYIKERAVNAKHLGITSNVNASQKLQLAFDSGVESIYFPPDLNVICEEDVVINSPCYLYGQRTRIQIPKFRIKTGDFVAHGLFLDAGDVYDQQMRGLQWIAYEDKKDYSNIKIINCDFRNYFYATEMRGIGYSSPPNDPSNRIIQNTLIMGCSARTWSNRNAGLFQHIGITDAKVVGCSTYGGQNATSYNFINGNGYLIVSNCFDNENSYGSLEIENNDICYSVVTGNVFRKQLWIDDSSNVSIVANTIEDRIYITSETHDCNDITIVGNNLAGLSADQFGGNVDPEKSISNLNINGNSFVGNGERNNAVYMSSRVDSSTVENNNFSGSFTGSNLAVILSEKSDILVRNNSMNGAINVSGDNGVFVEYGNKGVTSKPSINVNAGNHISRMMDANTNWLIVPDGYILRGHFVNSLDVNESHLFEIAVPNIPSPTARAHEMQINIRNHLNNTFSCFKLPVIQRTVGNSHGATIGDRYAEIGINTPEILIEANEATENSINIIMTNNSEGIIDISFGVKTSNRIGTALRELF